MKRVLSRSQIKKFKICLAIFSIWLLGAFVQVAVAATAE
jgi:hypothetical protein